VWVNSEKITYLLNPVINQGAVPKYIYKSKNTTTFIRMSDLLENLPHRETNWLL